MHEAPTVALKAKPDSSMRRAIDLVNDGSAAACVSAGNTGALTAMGTLVIKRLPGIERPAIVRALPRAGGHVHMLDLGASNDASPKRLFQFGIMGAMLSQYFDDNSHPTIGLLNIGTEEGKGSDSLNEAANLFRRSPLNYIGYVEGNDIYDGQVDVIVCDGFSGNVALKTSEGLSVMLHAILKEEYGRNFMSRMAGLCSLSVLRRIKARTDRRRFNGAMLLGLRRPVIKSHGSADSVGITQAIKVALEVVEKDIVTHIADQMEQLQD
jgi:glycerol-3-phosphate acyltransferase PlsX